MELAAFGFPVMLLTVWDPVRKNQLDTQRLSVLTIEGLMLLMQRPYNTIMTCLGLHYLQSCLKQNKHKICQHFKYNPNEKI